MAHTVESQPIPLESQKAGHEVRDTPLVPIIGGFIGLATLLGTAIIVVIFLLGYFGSTQIKNEVLLKQQPVGPKEEISLDIRLQANPERDMIQIQQKNEHVLHSYGWVDKAKTHVHIPIEKAMEKALSDPNYFPHE